MQILRKSLFMLLLFSVGTHGRGFQLLGESFRACCHFRAGANDDCGWLHAPMPLHDATMGRESPLPARAVTFLNLSMHASSSQTGHPDKTITAQQKQGSARVLTNETQSRPARPSVSRRLLKPFQRRQRETRGRQLEQTTSSSPWVMRFRYCCLLDNAIAPEATPGDANISPSYTFK